MKWKKVKEKKTIYIRKNSINIPLFFVPLLLHTHIYISVSIISLHEPPPTPPTSPTEAILFSTCFLCALKGSWGGSFCIERFSMNVPFDRYHTTELGRKKKRTSHSFPLSWRYIKCCTRKTVYEKVGFFQASYIVKEVRCIHLTNLYSLCEQVASSKKEKLYPHISK